MPKQATSPFPALATLLARRMLRLAVMDTLIRCRLVDDSDKSLQSPGDRPTPTGKIPVILVKTPDERKDSVTLNGPPTFNTICYVQVEAKLLETTAERAQDRIEFLGFLIENAVLRDVKMQEVVQKFDSVETKTEVNAEGEAHLGAITVTFGFQVFELFTPDEALTWNNITDLAQLFLTLDTAWPFDKDGTYPITFYQDEVPDSPRTSGPDGRAEGTLVIDNTTEP